MTASSFVVSLRPWSADDLSLLEELNAPQMTEHLGGPEPPEKVTERHQRYLNLDPTKGRMFVITLEPASTPVGSVGYWDKTWQEEEIYEVGWGVVPSFQGRGIALQATKLAMEQARADGRHRSIHAFPSVENAPSNAIARKLGMELLGEADFEYPVGHWMRCNDWRLEL
jgi:RimJ/RimL family protein N-acetyltransferase